MDDDYEKLMPRHEDPGFGVLNHALTPHKETLEQLTITLDMRESWWWSYRGVGSLTHFHQLKRIEVAATALGIKDEYDAYMFDNGGAQDEETQDLFDVLPASLYTLVFASWLRGSEYTMLDFADSLSTMRNEFLPNFRHFVDHPTFETNSNDLDPTDKAQFIRALRRAALLTTVAQNAQGLATLIVWEASARRIMVIAWPRRRSGWNNAGARCI